MNSPRHAQQPGETRSAWIRRLWADPTFHPPKQRPMSLDALQDRRTTIYRYGKLPGRGIVASALRADHIDPFAEPPWLDIDA